MRIRSSRPWSSWSGRAFGWPYVRAFQPVVDPDREVAEDGGDAGDRQVGEPQWLGAEQVAEGWHVQSGDLQREGDRDRDEQKRVGRGAGTGPDAEGDAQLGDAEGQEHHALPWTPGGMPPEADPERDRGDDDADADDALPQAGPEHTLGGGPRRPAHDVRFRGLGAKGDARQPVRHEVD